MPKKISKVARELNVGVSTAVEFLHKHGVEVDGNPNARIDDAAVELLYKEYSQDKDAKAKSDQMTKASREEKEKKNQRAERQEKPEEKIVQKPGLKVVGKIDLENIGKSKSEPVVKSDEAAEDAQSAVLPAEPSAEAVAVPSPAETGSVVAEQKEADTGVPSSEELPVSHKPENKENKEPDDAPVSVAVPESDTTEKTEAEEKVDTSEPVVMEEKPVVSEIQSVQPVSEEKSDENIPVVENKPFRLHEAAEAPKLKVLGTIDLSTIDSGKSRKRGDKGQKGKNKPGSSAASSQASGQNGTGTGKKKRNRINQSKVDIDQAARQAGNRRDGGRSGNDNRQQGKDNRQQGNNGRGQRRNVRPEVSTEDVQKQVKETLARLTNKQTKKSVKWRKEKREEIHNREMKNAEREAAESKVLKITEFVTANDLAQMMDIPINKVIATCMSIGVMVSINQRLDAETINLVADEFGFTTEYVSAEVSEAIQTEEDAEEDLVSRPPIVTVMGHVDHGKTSLLDYIRKANVIAGEAGGITQHIGAYNVELNDGRHITFLDTPGHEAFTAMRARGAKVTDLAIIIVAADDDVMPQTREAINHASAAGVPIVFAINKIDKPTANPDKIKEELAQMNYLVEDWGGKYQSQDISAKKGTGVEDLMDKVLLEAELLDLKANPNRMAIGSVIESSLDKGRGYVATVLVQNGTLKVGDVVLAGTHYGKIKAMFNERNQRVKEAGPATPVLVLGLNGAPTAGDTFNVMATEQEAREIAGKREQLQRELGLRTKKRLGLEELGRRQALGDFHELNLVVKGDVDGSVEALSDSLIKLSTPEVQVNVLHKGVGAISESDVTLAAASDAIIIGFQVRPSGAARKEAEKEGVEIRLYSVIYKAIEEVKDAMEGMLSPEIKEEITGTAEVLQTYKISKVGTIAGAIVRDGKVKRTSKVRLIRDGIVIYTGELGSLKRFKDDAKEVISGYDCGLSIENYNDIREGDLIEAYEEVAVKKTLS